VVLVLVTQKPVGAMRLVTLCCFELSLISILQTVLKGMGLSPCTSISSLSLSAFHNLQVPLRVSLALTSKSSPLSIPHQQKVLLRPLCIRWHIRICVHKCVFQTESDENKMNFPVLFDNPFAVMGSRWKVKQLVISRLMPLWIWRCTVSLQLNLLCPMEPWSNEN
jgi:hypothetical protein